MDRSSARYRRHGRADEAATVARVRAYAHAQPMHGYRMITARLRQDGHAINRKRVYRIWRQEGLQLPRRVAAKRRYGTPSGAAQRASHPNELWTYDIVEVRTEQGAMLRMLTVLDEYTRECLSIYVARRLASRHVLEVLEWLFLLRGAPAHLRSDNGPQFIARAVQAWLRERHWHTLYITPGSPWENPFIESFHGTFRAECLNRWVFVNGPQAQTIVEAWRLEYNERRPHSSLGYMPPAQFARQVAAAQPLPVPRVHPLTSSG